MSSIASLDLYFANISSPSLYKSIFIADSSSDPIVGIRGYFPRGTSQALVWGTTLQALSIFFIRAVSMYHSGKPIGLPLLEGFRDSPVAPIGRLLDKGQISTVHDLFGYSASGRSCLQRILTTSNTRFRNAGPASIGLKTDYLSPENIEIYLDERCITKDPHQVKLLLKSLQTTFAARSPRGSALKMGETVSACEA